MDESLIESEYIEFDEVDSLDRAIESTASTSGESGCFRGKGKVYKAIKVYENYTEALKAIEDDPIINDNARWVKGRGKFC